MFSTGKDFVVIFAVLRQITVQPVPTGEDWPFPFCFYCQKLLKSGVIEWLRQHKCIYHLDLQTLCSGGMLFLLSVSVFVCSVDPGMFGLYMRERQ